MYLYVHPHEALKVLAQTYILRRIFVYTVEFVQMISLRPISTNIRDQIFSVQREVIYRVLSFAHYAAELNFGYEIDECTSTSTYDA